MLKVTHIIVGLNTGGAEIMLRRLVEAGQAEMESTVVSLMSLGPVGETLRSNGVRVETLGLTSLWQLPGVLHRLARLLRLQRPDVVQTWMYHADFLGGLAARLAGCRYIAWGVHAVSIPQTFPARTWWLVRINALLSHVVPHRIVLCAESARQAHLALGYAGHKMVVIQNGYDFRAFTSSAARRERIRRELDLHENTRVVGFVARFDPAKDVPNFLAAGARLAARVPNVRFLMIGSRIDHHNEILRTLIAKAGLEHMVKLEGEQRDVPLFLEAMDVFCLSSKSEAFPNVVVEAMAMERPCVVTAVGDVPVIVGETGRVVPAADAIALSDALAEVLCMPQEQRTALGRAAGQRVRERYGIDSITRRYIEEYRRGTQAQS